MSEQQRKGFFSASQPQLIDVSEIPIDKSDRIMLESNTFITYSTVGL